jgi:hypothetical protein
MGRLTLNVLLSFAQFEREVTGERIRDKIAASKKKGLWMGGWVPLGFDADGRTLKINEIEAETVRRLFRIYLELGTVASLVIKAKRLGLTTKPYVAKTGRTIGGRAFSRGHLYKILSNPLYAGEIAHRGRQFPGQHPAIIDRPTWDAVQAQLKSHTRERQVRFRAAEPIFWPGCSLMRTGRNSRAPTRLGMENGTGTTSVRHRTTPNERFGACLRTRSRRWSRRSWPRFCPMNSASAGHCTGGSLLPPSCKKRLRPQQRSTANYVAPRRNAETGCSRP